MNRTVYSCLLSGYTTSLMFKWFLGSLQENTGTIHSSKSWEIPHKSTPY